MNILYILYETDSIVIVILFKCLKYIWKYIRKQQVDIYFIIVFKQLIILLVANTILVVIYSVNHHLPYTYYKNII